MKRFHSNQSGGLYGMWAENTQSCMTEAQYEENPDTTHCLKLVEMVQVLFRYGCILEDTKWRVVVLLPKGGRYFRGIVLMEDICKVISIILDHCLGLAIEFHDVIHGFMSGHRMVNAYLKAKMIQHLEEMREEVLYEMFLDLHKAYNAMARYRCLEILEVYGVGIQDLRVLWRYWDRLVMVAWAGR